MFVFFFAFLNNLQVVVNNAEIVVRIETPESVEEAAVANLNAANLAKLNNAGYSAEAKKAAAAASAAQAKQAKQASNAVSLTAELSIQDVLDDVMELLEHVKVFLDPVVSETASDSGYANQSQQGQGSGQGHSYGKMH